MKVAQSNGDVSSLVRLIRCLDMVTFNSVSRRRRWTSTMKRHVPLIVTLLSLACGNEPTSPTSHSTSSRRPIHLYDAW